jgi:DNA-binding FadR family transcriptional regulator
MHPMSDGAAPELSRIKPAYEQAAGQLQALIVSGSIKPGERLPAESELIVALGVSRSTVREALRMLSTQGLIRTVRGVHGGNFVSEVNVDAVGDFLESRLGLLTASSSGSQQDLREVRELMEVQAAGLAAARRTDDDLVVLRRLVAPQNTVRVDTGPDPRLDRSGELHDAILAAAHNDMLTSLAAPVIRVVRHNTLSAARLSADWERADRDHALIVECIADGDADAAADAMRQHLDFAGELNPQR